ncbi:MAG TPA: hypothetical protein VLM85_04185 [Polyangiaceae bacterium]|nr:hypothetical protein [Polyangiaceae bacterium]
MGFSLAMACGPAAPSVSRPAAQPPAGVRVVTEPGRPSVAVLAREGDPSSAIAVVVTTAQIGADRGSVVPVSLAAIVEARLRAKALVAEVVPDAEHVRVRTLVRDAAAAEHAVATLRQALSEPISAGGPELEAMRKKLGALRALPRPPPTLLAAGACESRLSQPDDAREPTAAELEGWRGQAAGVGRVVFAAVGTDAVGRATVRAISKMPAWPAATPLDRARPAAQNGLVVFDASGELPAGTARAVLVARVDPQRVGSMARALGDPAGPLVARLRGLERGTALASVSATRHAGWGCIALDVRVPADARATRGAAAIAQAVVLAEREVDAAGREAPADASVAPDVRDGAEQLALTALALEAPAYEGAELGAVAVGLPAPQGTHAEVDWSAARDAIAREKSALDAAWKKPAVEGRVRVEAAQPETFVLLASPCGTAAESDEDAGISALVAVDAARRARAMFGVDADPWVASDAVGLIGHAPARSGETPAATIRRIADAIARSFIVDAPDDIGAAQGALLSQTNAALSLLAAALVPSHASWLVPAGTQPSLLRATSSQVAARAEALRSGPLRAVVLSNVDDAQAREGIAALDRWALRTPQARACPAAASPPPPRPGTYAVETDGPSEVYVACPLPADALRAGTLIAAALDGPDGMLQHALGAGMVRSASARVLGAPRAPALVIHLDAPAAALDAAVSQSRALLDRLQHGALAEADLARARKALAERETRDALDPRGRAIATFRADGHAPDAEPGLDAVRAACTALRDSSLVIVAARPRGRRP